MVSTVFDGALEGTRTPDLLVRSQSLYPTELPARSIKVPMYISTTKKKMQVFFSKSQLFFLHGASVDRNTCFDVK